MKNKNTPFRVVAIAATLNNLAEYNFARLAAQVNMADFIQHHTFLFAISVLFRKQSCLFIKSKYYGY